MRIQLKRSSTLLEDGSAKPPSSTQMEYGELAVNFNAADPAIFFKDTDSSIVRIGGAGSIGQGTATIDLDAGPGLYITNPEFTLDQTDDQTIAVGIQLDTDDEVVGLEFAADRLRAKKATATSLGTIKEPEGLGIYMRQVTGSGEQWVLKDATVALPNGYPDLSDGDGSTLDTRYIKKQTNQTYTGNRLTINQNLTVGNDLDANKINASGMITGNVTGDLTGNADTATNATNADDATNADTAKNCNRQVIAGAGLTGGGKLTANRTLDVGAADATIIVEADGIRVDQSNLNFTAAAKDGAININASNGLEATGNNATANQGGSTTRTISGIDATTEVKGVVQLNNETNATWTTRAGTANSVRLAYNRAEEYAPSKTGANASGTWGIDITGNAATADVAASVTGNIDSATRADNADKVKVTVDATDVNRPFVFIPNTDNASGTYEDLIRDSENACFINPSSNTIGATDFAATSDVTAGGIVSVVGRVISPLYSNDGNVTIQPSGTTQGRGVNIYPGEDDDGVAGNIVIGKGNTTGGGGHIYFRGNGGSDQFRFAKSGQTSIEGFLSFESLTTDRTFTFPNTTGTIALTTSKTSTSGTADNANKVDVNASTGNSDYPLLFHNISVGTSGYSSIYYSNSTSDNGKQITMNPRSGKITATTFAGNATTATTATNSDKVDNLHASSFLRADANDSASGELTLNGKVNFRTGADFADGDYIYMGSSDDFKVSFNSNGWLYIDQNASGIIFRDGTTNKMRLEDSGVFRPESNNTGTLGSSSVKWKNVYATTFTGALSGNATTATTATNANNVKRATYSGSSTWRDIAAWTATSNSYEDLCNATSGYVQISGNGKLRASGNITAASLNGTLSGTDVRNAIAGGGAGGKGTYALLTVFNTSGNFDPGTTSGSSNLYYSNCGGNVGSKRPSGSWRLMGRIAGASGDQNEDETSVWLRYS